MSKQVLLFKSIQPELKDKIQLIKEETQQDQQLQMVGKLVLQDCPKYQLQVPQVCSRVFPLSCRTVICQWKINLLRLNGNSGPDER